MLRRFQPIILRREAISVCFLTAAVVIDTIPNRNNITCASKRTVAKTNTRGKTEPNHTHFQKQHAEGVGLGQALKGEAAMVGEIVNAPC